MKSGIRFAALAFGSAIAATLVAGCGGGGGGGNTATVAPPAAAPSAPAAPPAATAAQYLSWTSARKADGTTGVTVIDEANPSVPRFSFSVSDLGGKVVSSLASTLDSGAATETILGDAALHYIDGGIVRKLSLKKSAAQTPQQLSTLTGACSFFSSEQLDLAGEDLWLGVVLPGADGNCASGADNTRSYVRTTMTAASAPLAWPSSTEIVTGLTEADGTVANFLAREQGATLALYDANLQRVASVANGASATSIEELAADLSAPRSAYFVVNGRLRRLAWSPTGATLSADLYTFLDIAGTRSGASDRSTMYFTDGNRVLRIDGAATAATQIALIPGRADASDPIALTPTAIIIPAVTTANRATIYGQPRTGAAAADLTGQTTATGPDAFMEALRDETVVYTQLKSNSTLVALHSVVSNGQGNRLIADNLGELFNGHIFSPTVSLNNDSLGAFRLDSVIGCQPAANQGACSPAGTLVQYDLASGATTSLGTIASTGGAAAAIVTNIAVSSQPFALSVFSTDSSRLDDGYLAVAGRANSLIPILRNRP